MHSAALGIVAATLASACGTRSTIPRRAAVRRLAAGVTTTSALAPLAAAAATASERGYGPLLQGPFDFPSASRATVRRSARSCAAL